MIPFKEFKSKHGIDNLNMYKSTQSSRFISSFGDLTIITTEDFNPDEDVFVYQTDKVDEETGEVVTLHVLSNKEPREADLVL